MRELRCAHFFHKDCLYHLTGNKRNCGNDVKLELVGVSEKETK
ncbi:putative Zinc finger, RING/FYVE/PHD-type [Rosa chinensis]|uniref:Putative Zinc finger, RING/FYVE/PHD-type n=1 Tax=Rosa chinensis TaxID=74649 RepID=A0A2P6SA11_ROSCH|nr:putative Zinc finger, RING/FYVE/PHD-type [Rosa chinensis]